MRPDRGLDMAIPRVFYSNTPFVVVTAGSELSFPGKEDEGRGSEEDPLVAAIAPHLGRVMQLGTAKHMVSGGGGESEEDPGVCIVAQAESEDFQEFSPTTTRGPGSACRSQNRFLEKAAAITSEDEEFIPERFHPQRKQRRKTRSRPMEGEEPPIIQGLWVQEIDWLKSPPPADIVPPPPQFTDSLSGRGDQHTSAGGGSDSESGSGSDSSCCSALDLMHVSDFKSSSTGREQSMLGLSDSDDASDALEELRGRVTQTQKTLVSAFFRDLMKPTLNDWKTTKHVNEGLVFHPRLQPIGRRYREGEEYRVLQHIHSGSYGDVFRVRDSRTGFQCAAKRVPLSLFSSREVGTWSLLDSPRVVELFGAVREGLHVVLFMDLKPGCLAQLLKEMNSLPEDLALHYLHQTLGALEHLHHRKVLHLDVKAANVLLSADARDAFLCDFGLSAPSDRLGTESFRGAAFPGTETHMAPEVARGDGPGPRADVWSSCCMLLHMLNGCQPWTRYYCPPLCLQIVNEPPPLWEVPSTCNNFTAGVFRAGLRKDPDRRASARELRRKTTKALRAVGGLRPGSVQTACETLYRSRAQTEPCRPSTEPPDAVSAPVVCWVSPWRTSAAQEDQNQEDREDPDSKQDSEAEMDSWTRAWDSQPKPLRDDYPEPSLDWGSGSGSDVDIYLAEEDFLQGGWSKTDGDYEGDWEEEGDSSSSSSSSEFIGALRELFPLLQKAQETNDSSWGSEPELEHLRDDVPEGTALQTPSPEPRDDPPSCFSSSQVDDSEKDSDHSSDDMSSGVFSSDGHLEWLVSANQPPPSCFQGVDIWIENVGGECLRIRERRQVPVGHVAVGVSDQISGKSFTLETLDRKSVSSEQQVTESGLWFRCVPAPDRCPRWRWRVRDGELELRD